MLQRFISLAVIAVAVAAAYPVAAQQTTGTEKKPDPQTNLADAKASSKKSKDKKIVLEKYYRQF